MRARTLIAATLLAATVAAFWAYDRHSHSASDTLRPFVLTMAPIWLLAGLALHRRTK